MKRMGGVLVTGAAGFIGRAVVASLQNQGRRVIACISPRSPVGRVVASRVYRVELPSLDVESIVGMESPDWVVHCAGASSVLRSVEDPDRDWLSNVAATECLYQAIERVSPNTRVIFLSSAAVYGQPKVLPIDEQTPLAPLSPYGRHKVVCETIGDDHGRRTGIEPINLRIFSAYGEGLEKQVLWDLQRKAQESSTIVLDGDGSETRDFIHVDDVVRTIGGLIDDPAKGRRVVNVATGSSIPMAALAGNLMEALGIQRSIVFSGRRSPAIPSHWEADVKLLESLALASTISLPIGLQRYAQWLKRGERIGDASRFLASAG